MMNNHCTQTHGIVNAGFSGFPWFLARKKAVITDRLSPGNPAQHHTIKLITQA